MGDGGKELSTKLSFFSRKNRSGSGEVDPTFTGQAEPSCSFVLLFNAGTAYV